MNGRKLHLWKNKRFTRLLASNFLLWASVFGALVLSMLMISRWYSVQSVYDQHGDVNSIAMNRAIEEMGTNLQNKRHIALRIASNSDVEDFMRVDNLYDSYESVRRARKIHEELMTYCLWDEEISSLFIFSEKHSQIISSDYGTQYAFAYKDVSWKDAYGRMKQGEKILPFLRDEGENYNNKSVLTIMQHIPIIQSQLHGVVVLNVNHPKLFDGLFGEKPYLITGAEGEELYASGLEELGIDVEKLLQDVHQQPGNHLVKLGQNQVLVTVGFFDTYDWWVYSIDQLIAYNRRVENFDNVIMILMTVGLLLVLLFSYMLTVRMFVPVKHIMYVMEERRDEMIMPVQERLSLRNEFMFIADAVTHTLDRNKELSSILEERLKKLNQVRLRMLQSQVDPHFLYNTLASINWMALEKLPDDNEISDALCSLSELLRERLKNTGFISLAQEVEQVERYVTLQKLCFEEEIELVLNAEEKLLQCAVPSMILQTLVENAIKHGLDKVEGKALTIWMEAQDAGEQLRLCVQDDGKGIGAAELNALRETLRKEGNDASRGIGLSNVAQQLSLLFGDDAYINLSGQPEGGFKVEIMIPNIKISDLNRA